MPYNVILTKPQVWETNKMLSIEINCTKQKTRKSRGYAFIRSQVTWYVKEHTYKVVIYPQVCMEYTHKVVIHPMEQPD